MSAEESRQHALREAGARPMSDLMGVSRSLAAVTKSTIVNTDKRRVAYSYVKSLQTQISTPF